MEQSRVVLMVMYDGRVDLDVGYLTSNAVVRLLHYANFVVIEREGKLLVWKERYEHDLRGQELTHQQMFEHAVRHVRECKRAAG